MAKNKAHNVTIRVRLGESELEVTGPIDFAEKKIAEFIAQQKRTPEPSLASDLSLLPPGVSNSSLAPLKRMSEGQFFKKVNPRTDVDRAVTAAYYLEKMRDKENFTANEVKEVIRKAKVPPPKNPSDAIQKNIKKGYVMVAGNKEGKMAFVLTTDGEEYIGALFSQ